MNLINLINFLINNPCEAPNILKVVLYVKKILDVVFVGVPIVLIVLVVFDFVKCVMAGNEDEIKKKQKLVIKRVVYSVLLFFVMPVVNIAFAAFDGSSEENSISDIVNGKNVNYLSCWTNAESIETISKLEKKVLFDGNGGTVWGESTQICGGSQFCEIVNFPRAQKKGYKFYGWSLDKKDICTDVVTDIYLYDKETTYYACFAPEDKEPNKVDTKPINDDIDSFEDNNNLDDSGTIEKVNSNLVNHTLNKSKYYVLPNSIQFATYARNGGYYQNYKKAYRDKCLGFSYLYANAIKNNDNSIVNKTSLAGGNNPKLKNISFKALENNSKSTILKEIYNQINKLNPVIVHINGNKEGTSRHYSVIVGYKTTTNPTSLKESDFLLIDVAEANVEQMNGKGKWNGSTLDKMNSRFMITGKATGRTYGYQLYVVR